MCKGSQKSEGDLHLRICVLEENVRPHRFPLVPTTITALDGADECRGRTQTSPARTVLWLHHKTLQNDQHLKSPPKKKRQAPPFRRRFWGRTHMSLPVPIAMSVPVPQPLLYPAAPKGLAHVRHSSAHSGNTSRGQQPQGPHPPPTPTPRRTYARASFEEGGGGGEGVLDPKLGVPKMA